MGLHLFQCLVKNLNKYQYCTKSDKYRSGCHFCKVCISIFCLKTKRILFSPNNFKERIITHILERSSINICH